jgi:hypothetical protein
MLLLPTPAYSCLLLPTPAYSCLLLPTPAYSCLPLPTPAHLFITLEHGPRTRNHSQNRIRQDIIDEKSPL